MKNSTACQLLKHFFLLGVYLMLGTTIFERCHPSVPAEPPDWAYDAIWYQIFPERFCNGDRDNDPTVSTLKDTWPYATPKNWSITPWTAEWYRLQPWEKENAQGFYYNAQLRRYGGDIQGIIQKLDYLQELGINAIYLNPVFESASAHKYGATYYHHIDNNFGPDPKGDSLIWALENPADPTTWRWSSADSLFLRLIKEVHQRGMHIIIDGVFNHVGIPFWAFQDVKQRGELSEFSGWFIIKSFDDPDTPADEFIYQGWANISDLPEIWESRAGPPREFKQHIRAIVRRWGDPNGDGDPSDGIDGWRLDVADKVSKEFWREFRRWVKAINPEAYLVGEVWWEDFFKNRIYNAAPWLQGDIFDGVMNYRFADIMLKCFIDTKPRNKPSQLNNLLGEIRQQYPQRAQYVSQNLMGSHDTERFASMVANPDRWLDHACHLQYNPEFNILPPSPAQRRKQLAIIAFQFAYLGAPYIYYGDEVGMWGADDPDCRKPMVWQELQYEPETVDPYGKAIGLVPVKPNLELYHFYQEMIRIRKDYPALRRGKYLSLVTDDKNGVFAFERANKDDVVRVVFNLTDQLQKVAPAVYLAPEPKHWRLIFSVNDENRQFLSPNCVRMYVKVKRGQE